MILFRVLATVVLMALSSAPTAAESLGIYQQGTIIRMRVGDCLPEHGLMATLAGNTSPQTHEVCPEYTLVAHKVVYVIVGRPSRDVLPLAETVDFRLRKNEIAIRVDDDKHEIRFTVREMSMRVDWERLREEKEQMQGTSRFGMPVLRSE